MSFEMKNIKSLCQLFFKCVFCFFFSFLLRGGDRGVITGPALHLLVQSLFFPIGFFFRIFKRLHEKRNGFGRESAVKRKKEKENGPNGWKEKEGEKKRTKKKEKKKKRMPGE